MAVTLLVRRQKELTIEPVGLLQTTNSASDQPDVKDLYETLVLTFFASCSFLLCQVTLAILA